MLWKFLLLIGTNVNAEESCPLSMIDFEATEGRQC